MSPRVVFNTNQQLVTLNNSVRIQKYMGEEAICAQDDKV